MITESESQEPQRKIEGLERPDNYRVIVKKGYVPNMKVDGIIYVNDYLYKLLHYEMDAVTQVANVAALPGLVGNSMAMPDIHIGYGFAIGNVCAMDMSDPMAVVSPGGVGFDINCGVRVIRTNLKEKDVTPVLDKLATAIYHKVPVGTGAGGCINVYDLDGALERGLDFLIENGLSWPEDREVCEDNGHLLTADPSQVSTRAKTRGRPQAGSLGSGNHYIEIQVVDEVFDEKAAKVMGLEKGEVCVMIHSGSRGLGHQVCGDYLKLCERQMSEQGIQVNDRQLAAVRIQSPEGKAYLGAMAAAANFGFLNRGGMTWAVRNAFQEVFGKDPRDLGMHLVYDVAHNTAKIEDHIVNGEKKTLLVHRKGATRAFGPHHPMIPKKYQDIGQPVFIGGTMGTTSYVLTGTQKAMELTFGSTCHGAGRQMSRTKAKGSIDSFGLLHELQRRGIVVKCSKKGLLSEEAPDAYKPVEEVVQTCHDVGISKKVTKMRPLAVVKG